MAAAAVKGELCPEGACCFNSGGWCRYEKITGAVRPCGVGNLCDFSPYRMPEDSFYSPEKVAERRARRIIRERRAALYAEGKSDEEIAQACGYGISTIKSWRRRSGLAANAVRERKE